MLRTTESLIGFSTMLTLPLAFLSTAIIAGEAAPAWIRAVAAWNPVDWAVAAAREALATDPDWGCGRAAPAGLAAVALLLAAVATLAFRSYQRSV